MPHAQAVGHGPASLPERTQEECMAATEGIVFNIQRYCVHDGPGIRTTVFLKGCPLRCAWCSNPESHQMLPEPGYNKSKCLGCRRCIRACPLNALDVAEDGSIQRNKNLCKPETCTAGRKEPPCTANCPAKAMILYGRKMTASEVVDQVEKDTIFYRDGGGITLSGGEPLLQADFTREILKESKYIGIHTAIETTGFVDKSILDNIFPYLDYMNMDIKSVNNTIHKKYTGVEVTKIMDNLKYIYEAFPHLTIRIRTPVIPGVNDTEEDITAIARFLEPFSRITYELLPYHSMGAQKYAYLGKEYSLGEVRLADGRVEQLRECAGNILGERVISQG